MQLTSAPEEESWQCYTAEYGFYPPQYSRRRHGPHLNGDPAFFVQKKNKGPRLAKKSGTRV